MYYKKFIELCKENNVKPNNVTKDLGLSNATATHWKNGKIPNGETLVQVADYFNVSIDWLMDRTENKYAHRIKEEGTVKVTKGKTEKGTTTNLGKIYIPNVAAEYIPDMDLGKGDR